MNEWIPIPHQARMRYLKGELHFSGHSIRKLAKKYGTPLYVYDFKDIENQVRRLTNALGKNPHQIHFALKANSNLSVCRHLKSLGCGADIVSGGELFRALRAGFKPGKIVFSGVGKTEVEIVHGLRAGIHAFNIESLEELELIQKILTRPAFKKKTARIQFRFNPDVDARTHPYISTGLKENKFGMHAEECLSAVDFLKKHPRLQLLGLSIHIGSQILDLAPFEEAFRKTVDMIRRLESQLGRMLTHIDVGGGYGISYHEESSFDVEAFGELVQNIFGQKSFFKGRLHVGLEPGRFLVGNAGILLSRVLFRKKQAHKDFLIVDAAMNDFLRPTLYQSYHHILPGLSHTESRLRATDIVGPVCESSDFFAKDRPFSDAVKTDEMIAILSTGAYGFTMAGTYNSRPRPAEVMIQGKKAKLIRKRETLADLVKGE